MATLTTWQRVETHPALTGDSVHIWYADIGAASAYVGRLSRELSEDEHARASRFRFEKDRERFTIARAMLRQVLAHYLSIAATEVAFEYGQYGKPSMASRINPAGLEFNLSHAKDVAVCAVTQQTRVGVDVEYVERKLEMESIATRFFAAEETAAIMAGPQTERRDLFFNCWTRKEAYLKGKGNGITVNLDTFAVSVNDGVPVRLLRADADPEAPSRWSLEAFTPTAGYKGAIAIESRSYTLQHFQWQPA